MREWQEPCPKCGRAMRQGASVCRKCWVRPDAERFWEKVNKAGPIPPDRPELGPCWLWLGHVHQRWRYGSFGVAHGKLVRAHRYAYEAAAGTIPGGLVLDHLCRVRHCVNPGHLEPVTQRINCQRGLTGKAPGTTGERNKAKTHCPRGHAYDEANTRRRGNRRICLSCSRLLGRIREARRPPRKR